jgi:hypothetical protein
MLTSIGDSSDLVLYGQLVQFFAGRKLSMSNRFGKIARRLWYHIFSAEFNESLAGTKQIMYLFDASTVDDVANSWDGKRCFRDIGRNDDKTGPWRGRLEHFHLLIAG